MPTVVWEYWHPKLDRREGRYSSVTDLEKDRFVPFYDAAWELCRIGVLRPGEFTPAGETMARAFGDNYVITRFGRKWLGNAGKRPITDPSRWSEVLQAFATKF